jgi:hypothetical protein
MTHRLVDRSARLAWLVIGLGVGAALSFACGGFEGEDGSCLYDADCDAISAACPRRCVEGVCQGMPAHDGACDEPTDISGYSGPNTTAETSGAETSTTPTTAEPTTVEPTTVEPTTAEPTTTDADETTSTDPETTGGGNGVCGSNHTEGSPELDACATATCCAELDACIADAACSECLAADPPAEDCIEQPAFGAYRSCVFFGCPESLCMSPLVVEDRGGDPDFDCHACLFTPCCGFEAQFCLQDPVGCEACLAEADPAAPETPECQAAVLQVQQGAALLQDCVATNCAAECPGL